MAFEPHIEESLRKYRHRARTRVFLVLLPLLPILFITGFMLINTFAISSRINRLAGTTHYQTHFMTSFMLEPVLMVAVFVFIFPAIYYGAGIPPEDLDLIFAPFFKADEGGHGIGLATVQKIVDLYGGTIRAYNNGGACFEFALGNYKAEQDPV